MNVNILTRYQNVWSMNDYLQVGTRAHCRLLYKTTTVNGSFDPSASSNELTKSIVGKKPTERTDLNFGQELSKEC